MQDLNPTDQDILTVLADGRRQNRGNLAAILGKDPDYLSQRISTLLDRDLITRVGPTTQSGLYEITPTGRATIRGHDTPTDDETTRSPPTHPHLSPFAFDVLDTLAGEAKTLTEIDQDLNRQTSFIEYVLSGLTYQDLVQTAVITITKEYADVHAESTQTAWVLTHRGQAVLDHKPDWHQGGDPAVARATTNTH